MHSRDLMFACAPKISTILHTMLGNISKVRFYSSLCNFLLYRDQAFCNIPKLKGLCFNSAYLSQKPLFNINNCAYHYVHNNDLGLQFFVSPSFLHNRNVICQELFSHVLLHCSYENTNYEKFRDLQNFTKIEPHNSLW